MRKRGQSAFWRGSQQGQNQEVNHLGVVLSVCSGEGSFGRYRGNVLGCISGPPGVGFSSIAGVWVSWEVMKIVFMIF